ncbi:MAG: hypothetical protein K1X74_03145 [Pirellulales bacterium]|nr:hypothetical protein [Pirellulales bacterium]
MRRYLVRGILVLMVVFAAGGGLWAVGQRDVLDAQLRCYHLARAESFAEAQQQIAWFEAPPLPERKLRVLVTRWGTGNEQFDRYLADHVADAASTEALRQAFSLEFAWRPEQLERWAHYWRYRASLEPDEAVESVLSYLETMAAADPPRWITWRDVLDVQAVWQLAGHPELATRLTPENYRQRCARWIELGRPRPERLTRPDRPLPGESG